MDPLVRIRSQRDGLSAIERRIGDFLLDNASLLRDYSSQHVADALGISQSSVVKFAQKLGYRGYPDLKYSIGEALARGGGDEQAPVRKARRPEADDGLWQRKSRAEEQTRLLNRAGTLDEVARRLARAGSVYLIGLGEDDLHARTLALRLSLLGIRTVHNFDPAHMAASVSSAGKGDVCLLFCEHGQVPALCQIARQFHERRGHVVSVTRYTANAVRAAADIALVVAAHDETAHVAPLLYHSALQHLLDRIYVRLCELDGSRAARLSENLARIRPLLEV